MKTDERRLCAIILTSKELDEHAHFYAVDRWGLVSACTHGHLELVRFLLSNPELPVHADLHAYDDNAFIRTCQTKNFDVASYLLDFYHPEDARTLFEEAYIDWPEMACLIEDRIVSLQQKEKMEELWLHSSFNFTKTPKM